ncbi:MAG: DUF4445 domain-containing protein [Candidatus Marinimicrobia bacterium]|nr:DUF4445 domain-containing protein [Candidatus Neomarinimicrobiota bacterium]
MIDIKLEPLGKIIQVEKHTALQDVLFDHGVEFPCGGDGTCGKCKVRVIDGDLPINDIQRRYFSQEELSKGWRLACQCSVKEPVTLELAQWEMAILSDDSRIKVSGREGFGIAVDLGTTTLVVQLIDLSSGNVVGIRTALNPQAKYGADIMSRIDYALTDDGAQRLRQLIRDQLSDMIRELIGDMVPVEPQVDRVVIVGNTAMHHLFCGVDITPLSRVPFETENDGQFSWNSADIGWQIPGNPKVEFLPCLGGFVGSDILAGIIAAGIHQSAEMMALIDLGTNGEVVVGNRARIFCASTAAGPAFEGAKISMGMRATTGAISRVTLENRRMISHIIGGGDPKGICGSGLVDAVACALELGLIDKSGRILDDSGEIVIQAPVVLTQQDVRELQLAKGAIAAGFDILVQRLRILKKDIGKVHIAGAFGNYINVENAMKIGLLDFDHQKIVQAGNTALRGAKMALFGSSDYRSIIERCTHVPLANDKQFMEIFVDNMHF